MVVGDLTSAVDVAVVGGGPGGYVAALRLAQLGKIVALVDPRPPGGVCLHDGCIPAKSLLAAVGRAHDVSRWSTMGIDIDGIRVDLARMQAWKRGVVNRLAGGVAKLLAAREVEVVAGTARFESRRELRVALENGSHKIGFDQCVVATGAIPRALPGLPFDGRRVLTPAEALRLETIPASIDVVGSDYVAAELATLFARLGSAVRLHLPPGAVLLGAFDPFAARLVAAGLSRAGVAIVSDTADAAAATAAAPCVVVSAGTVGATGDLDLRVAGVEPREGGFLTVDDRQRTANPAVYAVGDVTGGPPFASVAIRQGKVAAETIAGLPAQYAPQAVPRVAWTDPAIASVGPTAAEAQAAGHAVVTGRFPFAASGRALTLDRPNGAALTVAERDTAVLLGVTVVGEGAAELIATAALALEMGATLTDLAEMMAAHPSLAETLGESAEAALGIGVHGGMGGGLSANSDANATN